MKQLLNISLILAGILFAGIGYSQNPEALVDRNEIRIGEQIELTLSVPMQSPSDVLGFPNLNESVSDGLEVIEVKPIDTIRTGALRLEQKAYLTAFDSGSYEIPGLSFQLNQNTATTEPIRIEVFTVEVDTTQGIYGSREGYAVEVGLWDYIRFYADRFYVKEILGGLALAGLVVALFVWLGRRNQKKDLVFAPKPADPPHVIALRDLRKLLSEKAYEKEKPKVYHTKLTEILREFIETTTNVQAHELTSRETMDQLRYVGYSETDMKNLRVILFRADMVKFAKEVPSISENESALKDALAFVEGQIPQEEPELNEDQDHESR